MTFRKATLSATLCRNICCIWTRLPLVIGSLLLILVLPALQPTTTRAAGEVTYHIDCNAGNDANAGTSTSSAWKSLSRAKNAALRPGDKLLLQRGCAWTGPLELRASGSTSAPIIVSAYGSGALPRIQNSQYGVVITGSYLQIEQLAASATPTRYESGCQNQPMGWFIGFRFESGASYNTLRAVEVSGQTNGVKILSGAQHNRVLNSTFRNNNLMYTLDTSDPSNDSGASAIVIEGDDNEIGQNTFVGQNACSYDFGYDGSAVEIYGGQRNNVHHNRANNNNTFTELGVSRSADNTFTYNLVTADVPDAHFLVTEGAKGGRGPIYRTRAYHNTIYLTSANSIGINCDGSCTPDILSFKNNIFWVNGKVSYTDQPADEGNNLYWNSTGNPRPYFPTPSQMSPTSRLADPRFVNTAGGDFHLRSDSPAINAGANLGSVYNADLDQTSVPQGTSPDIGVYEYAALVSDGFSRSVNGGWGNADIGGAYTHTGNAADFSVVDGTGRMLIGQPGATRISVLGNVSLQNTQLKFRVRTDKAANGNSQFAYVTGRRSSSGNEYRAKLRFAPGGTIYIQATRFDNGSEASIGSEVALSGVTHSANSYLWVRTQFTGVNPTTVRIRVWADGQPEPTSWQYVRTDTTASLQQAGSVGLRAYVNAASTTGQVLFTFDDFSVTQLSDSTASTQSDELTPYQIYINLLRS